ncbi:uncharacterized protein BDR25DRAFT_339293 [Lindgomyces ingoldianus]|uniref:Uncharacterized protein n=1 Tax=Lindgomyces ingoldianus TaxID=673940 RepID=A0ACB6RBT4_9PLEO|nr:uncharacterized protein BDR25DRAFT_339293 [Lindgomyces ingoldianus]KAF2476185.1 hypothetical protein BDR25DRAFT_339293 [Lindgomyces ingoldianus]
MCRCRMRVDQYLKITKARYEAQKPKPLSKRRFRELSPPPPITRRSKRVRTGHYHEGPQPQSTQPDCLLLNRLPAEIRLRIWEYAVGRQDLHILRKQGKMGYSACAGEMCKDCPKVDGVLYKRHVRDQVEPFKKDLQLAEMSLLNLLLTCRQIYSEAIDVLYTSNTFLFPHIWNLTFFQTTIRPKRFASIRSVHLSHFFEPHQYENQPLRGKSSYIAYPGAEVAWESGCKALLAMTKLRQLRIDVRRAGFYPANVSPLGLVSVFEPLKGLKVGDWTVEVTIGSPDWAVNLKMMESELRNRGLGISVVGKPWVHPSQT